MLSFWRKAKRFLSDKRGNVAVTFGMAASAIVAIGGGVIDYSKQSSAHTYLQNIADAAVLVGAKEMQLSGINKTKNKQISAVTTDYLQRNIKPELGTPVVNVTVETNKGTVDLSVTGKVSTPFFGMMGMDSNSDVTAKASARVLGGLPLCVLALEGSEPYGLLSDGTAKLSAVGCSVHSNSSNKNSVAALNSSFLESGLTCSSGGATGAGGNYSPVATTDCPAIDDPLSSRPTPTVSACDFNDFKISAGVQTLTPGVYCQGLKIAGNAVVTFSPGEYVIKDGTFEMAGNAKVTGNYVSFYFTGPNAALLVAGKASVAFSAPKDGAAAGLLMYEDKNALNSMIHEIASPNVKSLVGTIYFHKSQLKVAINAVGGSKTANESAFTVIIAKSLSVEGKSNLVLNTDYAATDVPLPQSISNLSGEIVIAK